MLDLQFMLEDLCAYLSTFNPEIQTIQMPKYNSQLSQTLN